MGAVSVLEIELRWCLARAIRKVQIKNLHMPVGKVVPILDGKLAKHMDLHAPAGGIRFENIGIIARERLSR